MSNYVVFIILDFIVNVVVKYFYDGIIVDDFKVGVLVYWGGGGIVIVVYVMGIN